MKNVKFLTLLMLIILIGVTSCQDDDVTLGMSPEITETLRDNIPDLVNESRLHYVLSQPTQHLASGVTCEGNFLPGDRLFIKFRHHQSIEDIRRVIGTSIDLSGVNNLFDNVNKISNAGELIVEPLFDNHLEFLYQIEVIEEVDVIYIGFEVKGAHPDTSNPNFFVQIDVDQCVEGNNGNCGDDNVEGNAENNGAGDGTTVTFTS